MNKHLSEKLTFWLTAALMILFLFSCRSIRYYNSEPLSNSFKEERMARFPSVMNETSGLEYFGGKFWTFNDSGGEALLYAFTPGEPGLNLDFLFTGLSNTDWEDISIEDGRIYIADIGNNFGNRDTLNIYSIDAEKFTQGSREFDTIRFSYQEKETNRVLGYNNAFDSEAIIARDGFVYLFTKNWVDQTSSIYRIPADPGFYRLPAWQRLNPGMLVTGADFDEINQKLWLIGYKRFTPIIIRYSWTGEVPEPEFSITLRHRKGLQVEGICTDASGQVWFTNELSISAPGLWKLVRP